MAKKGKSVKKSVKRRPVKAKRAKAALPKARPRPKDLELAAMGRELRKNTRSSMFKTESKDSRSKLVKLDEAAKEDNLMTYYKNMVFKCVKCDGNFDHTASLPPLEYELTCPHCKEAHTLRFTPASNLFTVHSKTVDVMNGPGS